MLLLQGWAARVSCVLGSRVRWEWVPSAGSDHGWIRCACVHMDRTASRAGWGVKDKKERQLVSECGCIKVGKGTGI